MGSYEELEGKIIDTNFDDGIKGKVVGCDYDIGITIVAADDPDNYLICLQGLSSPVLKKAGEPLNEERHKEMFNAIVNCIKKGKYDNNFIDNLWRSLGGEPPVNQPSVEICPFAQ